MTMQKLILVAGPTASGKSSRAIELAHQHNGVIINADALQIYAGLPILSAQPTINEQTSVPHKLYGTQPPIAPSSAGIWLTAALAEIKNTVDIGKTPILVGGTGLYFRALLGGLADIPDIPESVRQETVQLYIELGEAAFRQRLSDIDPQSAQNLARNDRQRLIRAYEVARYTGKAIGKWHSSGSADIQLEEGILSLPNLPRLKIESELLMPAREQLYMRCDARFRTMIEAGAINEVRALLAGEIPSSAPVMKTIGARELAAYLQNDITLDQAIASAQQATRNYAKRQMTWFRHQWNLSNCL